MLRFSTLLARIGPGLSISLQLDTRHIRAWPFDCIRRRHVRKRCCSQRNSDHYCQPRRSDWCSRRSNSWEQNHVWELAHPYSLIFLQLYRLRDYPKQETTVTFLKQLIIAIKTDSLNYDWKNFAFFNNLNIWLFFMPWMSQDGACS